MPGYIGYRPQFNPISLQEYLTVPLMIQEGRQKEADKIEQYQNEAEKWRALMGDSPEAQAIWANYDKALGDLGDNVMSNRAGDLARAARQLSKSYRDIKYKAENAQKALDEDTKRFANNPNLIGKPADFMTYYNNPQYRATAVNGKDIQDAVTAFADSYATTLPVENKGYLDPTTKHDIVYERGLTPNQKNLLYQDALLETPKTAEGKALRQTLQTAGVDLSNQEALGLAAKYIENGMRPLDRKGFTQTNPLFRTSGQQASDALAWMKVNEANENKNRYGTYTKPTLDKDEVEFRDDDGNDLILKRRSNTQYTVYKWQNGKKIAVPSYNYGGKPYASKDNTGIYEFEKPVVSEITAEDIKKDVKNGNITGQLIKDRGFLKGGVFVGDTRSDANEDEITAAIIGLKTGKFKVANYSDLDSGDIDAMNQIEGFNSNNYYILQNQDKRNSFIVLPKNDKTTAYVSPFIENNDTTLNTSQPPVYPTSDTTTIANLPV